MFREATTVIVLCLGMPLLLLFCVYGCHYCYCSVFRDATTVIASSPSSTSVLLKIHFESLLHSVNSDVNMQHLKECVRSTGNFYIII